MLAIFAEEVALGRVTFNLQYAGGCKMDVSNHGRVMLLADVDTGTVFIANIRGASHYCIKTFETQNGNQVGSLVSISPGHPDGIPNPGVLAFNELMHRHVYVRENISFELTSDQTKIQIIEVNPRDDLNLEDISCVFVFGDTPYLCVADERALSLVNLTTGELIQRYPIQQCVRVRQWRIVESNNLGKKVLAKFPVHEE